MLDEMVPNTDEAHKSRDFLSESLVDRTLEVGGKKDPFNLLDAADSNPKDRRTFDKVSRYNFLTIEHLSMERMRFIGNDFAIVRYWYQATQCIEKERFQY